MIRNTSPQNRFRTLSRSALAALAFLAVGQLSAQVKPSADGGLVDLAAADPAGLNKRFASAEKAPGENALILKFENDPRWPSIDFRPVGGPWDLSGFGRVEATLTNEGEQTVKTFLQVANATADAKKAIGEKADIAPGQTKTISVDLAAPNKMSDYKLIPSQVEQVRIFVGKVTAPSTLKLTSLKVVGATDGTGKN